MHANVYIFAYLPDQCVTQVSIRTGGNLRMSNINAADNMVNSFICSVHYSTTMGYVSYGC